MSAPPPRHRTAARCPSAPAPCGLRAGEAVPFRPAEIVLDAARRRETRR